MIRQVFLIPFLGMCATVLTVVLIACNSANSVTPSTAGDSSLQLTGTVSVVGNEPFSYINLETAANVSYRVVGPLVDKIQATLQYKTLTLKGTIVKEAIGPGFPAEFKAVEILKVR